MCFAGVLQVAWGGDSIVEPYFVVYFREWGSQFGTPCCLTVFEIPKKLFFPFPVSKLAYLLYHGVVRK